MENVNGCHEKLCECLNVHNSTAKVISYKHRKNERNTNTVEALNYQKKASATRGEKAEKNY